MTIRHPILASRIPADGFGRQITAMERKRLATLGVRVPVKARVVQAFGSDHIGCLYGPRDGGLTDLAISVTMVPGV